MTTANHRTTEAENDARLAPSNVGGTVMLWYGAPDPTRGNRIAGHRCPALVTAVHDDDSRDMLAECHGPKSPLVPFSHVPRKRAAVPNPPAWRPQGKNKRKIDPSRAT